jgi:hypothetical protein
MLPLVSANREELDIELLIKEGQIPTDIYGHVFVNSSVGSVNSNGLPYPKSNLMEKPIQNMEVLF